MVLTPSFCVLCSVLVYLECVNIEGFVNNTIMLSSVLIYSTDLQREHKPSSSEAYRQYRPKL